MVLRLDGNAGWGLATTKGSSVPEQRGGSPESKEAV